MGASFRSHLLEGVATRGRRKIGIRRAGPPLGSLLGFCAALVVALGLTGCGDPGGSSSSFFQRTYYNLAYATVSQTNKLDLYLPPQGSGPFPLVIWIHGGGWVAGDKTINATDLQMTLLQRNIALASVEYRLAGEAIFPAAIYDVKAAIRWLRAHADQYRLDSRRFAVWGASAGGHLAALAGTSNGVAAVEDLSMGNPTTSSDVQVALDWFGPTDFLQLNAEWPAFCPPYDFDAPGSFTSLFLGAPTQTVPDRAARANPITYVTPDDPVILIAHGTSDCVVPVAQSQILYDALHAAGVRATLNLVPGGGHGDLTFVVSQASPAIDFLDQQLHAL